MHLDANLTLPAAKYGAIGATAKAAEALGFGALWTPETQHNSVLPLMLAAEHTERIALGTAVAIAFPRSPMVMAQIAWDLQAFSRGRFILGLGTQVKAHIERRFGMAWEPPVAKLADYIDALRAIWASWQSGGKLDHRGPFYQHTLMSPFFNPGPIADPQIPIYIAGVNEGLARLAGARCDGFHVHPFHSAAYLRDVLRPQIAAGAAERGRGVGDVTMVSSVLLITGANDAAVEQTAAFAREQIAFYASTPTYRTVLAAHGWEDTGEALSRLASAKRWGEMGALIDDEMLETFAVRAPLDAIGTVLRARYDGLLDRVCPYLPYTPGPLDDVWRTAARQLAIT